MGTIITEDIYIDWINKWRRWKDAWFTKDDIVVEFCIQFVPLDKYTPNNHADLCQELDKSIGRSRICRDGLIIIRQYTTNESIVRVLNNSNIVTLGLDMFARRDILILVKILESLGHSVLHNGSIVSNGYNFGRRKYMLPYQDDPIWNLIN